MSDVVEVDLGGPAPLPKQRAPRWRWLACRSPTLCEQRAVLAVLALCDACMVVVLLLQRRAGGFPTTAAALEAAWGGGALTRSPWFPWLMAYLAFPALGLLGAGLRQGWALWAYSGGLLVALGARCVLAFECAAREHHPLSWNATWATFEFEFRETCNDCSLAGGVVTVSEPAPENLRAELLLRELLLSLGVLLGLLAFRLCWSVAMALRDESLRKRLGGTLGARRSSGGPCAAAAAGASPRRAKRRAAKRLQRWGGAEPFGRLTRRSSVESVGSVGSVGEPVEAAPAAGGAAGGAAAPATAAAALPAVAAPLPPLPPRPALVRRLSSRCRVHAVGSEAAEGREAEARVSADL